MYISHFFIFSKNLSQLSINPCKRIPEQYIVEVIKPESIGEDDDLIDALQKKKS